MKKIFTLLVMCFVTIAILAHDFEVNGIYYKLESTSNYTVKVTYKGTSLSAYSYHYKGDVVIPSQVTYNNKSYKVLIIGQDAFYGCPTVTSVTIPSSVTTIETRAFIGCYGLTSINFPSSVTSIQSDAFANCKGLTSVTIPKTVTSFLGHVFRGCIGLTSLKVESGNTVYDSRENCNAIIKTSTNTLIDGCKSTVIPNSVTSIGDYAFHSCTELTSITIPNSVTSFGTGVFQNCIYEA